MRSRKLLAFFSILITVIIYISVRQQCYAIRIEQSCVNDTNGNVLYTTTRNYNEQNKVTEVKTVDLKSKALVDYIYEYSNSGNMSKEKNNLTGCYREFGYDSIGQLVSERYYDPSGKLLKEINYKYDLKGNRTRKLVTHNNSTETTNYEYNNQSQIIKAGNQDYKYDERGNLVQDGSNTNTYDGKGKLVEVKQDNKVIETYQYGKDGARAKKQSNGVEEEYIYSEGQLSAITDTKGTTKFAFTRDTNGNLVSMTDYKDTYWYLFDGLWNVKGLANKEGTKVVSYEYDAYGNCIKSEGNISNPFRFMGYLYDDATGYYFLNARYYDPGTGRFISADGYTGDALVTSNMYKYANNNPLKYKDSNGHWSESIDSKLPKWAQKEILSLTVGWNNAVTNVAKDRIHAKANCVRAYAEKQNPTTLTGISAAFTVKYGSSGDDVRSLQRSLKDTGDSIAAIAVDGNFGTKTDTALKLYQIVNSLKSDGVAGINTWAKLGEVYYGVNYSKLNQDTSNLPLSTPTYIAIGNTVLSTAKQMYGVQYVDIREMVSAYSSCGEARWEKVYQYQWLLGEAEPPIIGFKVHLHKNDTFEDVDKYYLVTDFYRENGNYYYSVTKLATDLGYAQKINMYNSSNGGQILYVDCNGHLTVVEQFLAEHEQEINALNWALMVSEPEIGTFAKFVCVYLDTSIGSYRVFRATETLAEQTGKSIAEVSATLAVEKSIAQTMAQVYGNMKVAIKTSTEALNKLITKVYSKINGELEVEYAGIGRMKFNEAELIDDTDIIGQQRYKNFLEARWAETEGDFIDDAAEALLNGQQYTKDGRIKVLKPDVTYTSNGYTYKTDSLGRITKASGKLGFKEAPKNDYAQRMVGRIDRQSKDQGGHLIASRFNGSGGLDNLVPMDANLNQGAWKSMENTWAEALVTNQEVSVTIQAVYKGVSQRPTNFIAEYSIAGEKFVKIFKNATGG